MPHDIIECLRKAVPGQRRSQPTTTPVQVLPPDPNRTSIIFCPPQTADVTLSPFPGPTALEGIVVRTTDLAYPITVWHFGDLVRGPWYGITSAGTATMVCFTTSMLD